MLGGPLDARAWTVAARRPADLNRPSARPPRVGHHACEVARESRGEPRGEPRWHARRPVVRSRSAPSVSKRVHDDEHAPGGHCPAGRLAEVAACPDPVGDGEPGATWVRGIQLDTVRDDSGWDGGRCILTLERPTHLEATAGRVAMQASDQRVAVAVGEATQDSHGVRVVLVGDNRVCASPIVPVDELESRAPRQPSRAVLDTERRDGHSLRWDAERREIAWGLSRGARLKRRRSGGARAPARGQRAQEHRQCGLGSNAHDTSKIPRSLSHTADWRPRSGVDTKSLASMPNGRSAALGSTTQDARGCSIAARFPRPRPGSLGGLCSPAPNTRVRHPSRRLWAAECCSRPKFAVPCGHACSDAARRARRRRDSALAWLNATGSRGFADTGFPRSVPPPGFSSPARHRDRLALVDDERRDLRA